MGSIKPIALTIVASLIGFSAAHSAKERERDMKTVHNKRAIGREAPHHLARHVFEIGYTHRVEVLETKDAWYQVQPLGDHPPGWLHTSELTYKEIALKPVDKNTRKRIEKGKQSLLGRAFRPKIAKIHRQRYQKRDGQGHAWLDEHIDDEIFQLDFDEVTRFLEEGQLNPLSGREK